MIFAVFDPSPLTVYINCSFFNTYLLFYCQIYAGYIVILYSECLWKWIHDIKRINQSKSATTGADCRNGMVKRVKLRQRVKFRGDRSNRRRDTAIFRCLKMAAAAILDFSNFKFWTVEWLKRAEVRHRAKFGQNRSNRGRDMAIFRFLQRAAMLALQALY